MIELYEFTLSGNADVAVYPYIALAPEGGVDLGRYPAVIGWLARIQALPGYVGMPGMHVCDNAAETPGGGRGARCGVRSRNEGGLR
jgi:hypothetical protein